MLSVEISTTYKKGVVEDSDLYSRFLPSLGQSRLAQIGHQRGRFEYVEIVSQLFIPYAKHSVFIFDDVLATRLDTAPMKPAGRSHTPARQLLT